MNILPSLIDSSLTNQPYMLLLPLGLILIIGKLLSLLMAKIRVPEVVGYLLGGLIIGLFYFIPKDSQFIQSLGIDIKDDTLQPDMMVSEMEDQGATCD